MDIPNYKVKKLKYVRRKHQSRKKFVFTPIDFRDKNTDMF